MIEDAKTTSTVSDKFIGKWKKTKNFETDSDGKKYENALLFHGKADSIMLGATGADKYEYTVSSCKSLGNNDYILETTAPITHDSQTIYLHYYSKDKVGEKFNSSDDYTIFDSKQPILGYDSFEW